MGFVTTCTQCQGLAAGLGISLTYSLQQKLLSIPEFEYLKGDLVDNQPPFYLSF